MKFNIGSLISVNTDDKFHPVELSDSMVDLFFGLVSALHGVQAYRYRNSHLWLALHSVSSLLSAYWIYMIKKGYTHKGLGHASYGLLSTIPHITSLQVFGTIMTLDKLINYNDLVWPNGVKLFQRADKGPLNGYSADNMLVDNALIPKTPYALAVNVPFIAATGLAEYYAMSQGNSSLLSWVKQLNIGAGLVTAAEDWLFKYKPQK